MLQVGDFEQAVNSLRSAGLAPTFPRIAVIKLLLDYGPGVSADELVDRGREHGLPIAETDVTAVLADLREAGLAASEPTTTVDDSFANEAWDASHLLKAMSNMWRLRILCLLSRGEKCVGEIGDILGLSQSALSQHLSRLRQSGLVRGRRQRQQIFYAVTEPALPVVLQTLRTLRGLCRMAPADAPDGTIPWGAPSV